MNNVWKAVKLDMALVRPYLKVMGLTLVWTVAFAAINRSLLTGVSFAMCFMSMTNVYTFSITEKNAMERLFGILPIGKGALVLGRYLFVFALGGAALVISLLVQPLVLGALGTATDRVQVLMAGLAGMFLFTLYTVVQIPGYYKFGVIKGQVFKFVPVAGFLLTSLLLPRLPVGSLHVSPVLLTVTTAGVVGLMCTVSILLSIGIVKRKEV